MVVIAKDTGGPYFLMRLDLFFGFLLAAFLILYTSSLFRSGEWSQGVVAIVCALALLSLTYSLGAPLPWGALSSLMQAALFGGLIWSVMHSGIDTWKRFRTTQHYADSGDIRQKINHGVILLVVVLGLLQSAAETLAPAAISDVLTKATFAAFLGLLAITMWSVSVSPKLALAGETEHTSVHRKRQSKNELISAEVRSLQHRLRSAMEFHELYKHPQLQREEMATFIGAAESSVTEAIRRGLAANFFDFVNAYRIDAAKELLQQASDPIDVIMLEVGFNSKSSFYSEFKKRTGCSPGEFRRQHREQ
ncbi:MAG: AraC family transcriptional regulator [Pseudomonadota bacterium]